MNCLVCHKPVDGGCLEVRYGLKRGHQFKNRTHIGYVCKQCIPQWALKFYVNWSQSGSTVHVGPCSHCNYGWGPQWLPPEQSRAGTAWSDPFDTAQNATDAGKGPTGRHNCCP